jgi:hypothetical protein
VARGARSYAVRVMRLRPLACTALIAALALTGCGGDDGGGGGGDIPQPTPAPRAAEFPPAQGKATLGELIRGLPQGPQLAPSTSTLGTGPNRFGFALFDRGGKQINGAVVAIYTANASQADVRGPYPARTESLTVKPSFASQTSSQDPDAAKSVYVSRVPFQRTGRRVVIALAKLDGRLVASTAIALQVGRPGGPPAPGERAISIDTPTASQVGDVSQIDTRVPPGTMHDVNFADVLGRKPTVLVFATPALCQSRICGPVVDEAEQLKAQYGNRVAFVHMEIYNDNKLENGYRPQVRAWRLPSEPWVFVIGRDGRVVARYEGAVSLAELKQAIDRVARA